MVTTKLSYSTLIRAILNADVVSFDYETQSDGKGKKSNLEDWHPHSRIVSASFTIPFDEYFEERETWVVPLSHPDGPWSHRWKEVLTKICKAIVHDPTRKLVGHHIKYDARWTYSMTGVCFKNQLWWDTSMSSYILDENADHGLKDIAPRDLGVQRWDDVNLTDSESEDLERLCLYNARDTEYTLRLVPVHREELEAEPRLARLFHFLGMPIIRTLLTIERNGLPLDIDYVQKQWEESKKIVKKEKKYLLNIAENTYGMDLKEYPTISFGNSNFFKAFVEKAELPVLELTKKGNPSWTADVLEELDRQGHEIASHILTVRKHESRISKFFKPWNKKLGEDGRLHPSFNPMRIDDKYADEVGTTTGRLSSSNPNAQQIARELKPCFGGEKDWLFVELDYSQIELRILAWLAQDTNMLDAYAKGKDIHTLMAADITGKELEDVTKEERQGGKAGNFGFAYDMGESTYIKYARSTYGVHVSIEEARITRRAFFSRWSRVRKYHNRQRALVFRHGFVRNPIGRKRRLPEIRSTSDYLVGKAERRAINSPVQSMASDLMCLALIEIDKQLDPEQVKLVGTVHDSLLAQFRPENLEENLEKVASIMLDPGVERKFGVQIGVPLAVEAHIGYSWSDPDGDTRVFTNHNTRRNT